MHDLLHTVGGNTYYTFTSTQNTNHYYPHHNILRGTWHSCSDHTANIHTFQWQQLKYFSHN